MFFKKEKDYRKRTRYDLVKNVKKDNFKYLNENFCKDGQTIIFGDSITEIFNYYELFYEFCERTGQAVYNRGISGDTSDRLFERLVDNALNIKPRNLVILIGTNDLGVGAPAEFTENWVREILKCTKATCPETNIILQAVYPVNKHMNADSVPMVGGRTNAAIAKINVKLKALADEFNVQWLDLTDTLKNEKGNIRTDYCYDGLHLNANGFTAVAKNVIPLLK